MCKLLAITNSELIDLKPSLLNKLNEIICGAGDDHGFGYAALSSKGTVVGERTNDVEEFQALAKQSAILESISKVTERTSNVFGKLSDLHVGKDRYRANSLIIHGRLSTNDQRLENCHPFVSENRKVALIHNGIVYDTGSDPVVTDSTCDSEIILRYLERGGVPEIEANVSGYYAVMYIDAATGMLHVIKDDTAQLYITWCEKYKTFLVATTTAILYQVSSLLKAKIDVPVKVKANVHMQFKGRVLQTYTDIVPVKATKYTNVGKYSSLSALGYGELASDDGKAYSDLDDEVTWRSNWGNTLKVDKK